MEAVESLQEEPSFEEILPEPKGWNVLLKLPDIPETSAGGIYKPRETIEAEQLGAITGRVLKIGPDAFKDKAKFPSGPRCEVGDDVVMRSYSGSRIRVGKTELRIVADTSIEATCKHPEYLSKI